MGGALEARAGSVMCGRREARLADPRLWKGSMLPGAVLAARGNGLARIGHMPACSRVTGRPNGTIMLGRWGAHRGSPHKLLKISSRGIDAQEFRAIICGSLRRNAFGRDLGGGSKPLTGC